MKFMSKNENIEAKAFSNRIKIRSKKGFVPDLRNLKKCNFFYKSFWRRPDFAKIYVGEISKYYVNFFKKNLKKGSAILDIGCGPGYFSLELARAGFKVTAIDISDGAIQVAKKTLNKLNKKKKLNLNYICTNLFKLDKSLKFDGILCSGFLHHLNIKELKKTSLFMKEFLNKNGKILIYEPQHEEWTSKDAMLVYILRQVLNELNFWYDKKIKIPNSQKKFELGVKQIKDEFFYERDSFEKLGQSPNDLSSNKADIMSIMQNNFKLIHYEPAYSFIYRFIGGLRGEQQKTRKIAQIIAKLEKHAIKSGLLNANYFYASFKR
jgi:2-polyprenyl-3-methyl-5-hydroxy-6-metoxy-1,4-benzoquinol methylase